MTIANSPILNWSPPDAEHGFESDGTLMIPLEECSYIVVSPDATDYFKLIEEEKREYEKELLGEKLLHDVVDSIGRLAPLEVDGETQRLLDAAIQHQEMGPCDDLERWASRLADDVKDADD